MAEDLQIAFDALQAKQKWYSTLWDYYDGRHPLVYSTEKLRDIFKGINARFSENWCAVVVGAVHERISLKRFNVADNEVATKRLNDLWQETGMHLDDDEATLSALVCGEGFIVIWAEEEAGIEAYYNDARMCHIQYDEEHPRVKRFAAKWWVDADDKRRMILYYPDRVEYYISKSKSKSVQSWKNFVEMEEPGANPWGVVPVFHLRQSRRAIVSELLNVIEPQDAINKLLSDMMVAAEYSAFRQRYAVSVADLSGLQNKPGGLWTIPAREVPDGENTVVGEFSETNTDNFLVPIDKLATAIGAITRTPKHYFFTQTGDPSGESLIAMESPLTKKAERYVERYKAEMRLIGWFLLLLDGTVVDVNSIQPVYDDPRTVQPLTQAQVRQANAGAGMPLRTQLRREGWSDEELNEMDEDKRAEEAASQRALGSALVEAQKRFDRGNEEAA